MFGNECDKKVCTGHYFPKVEIKDYNVMIDAKNFFNHPVKSNIKTYDNIWKILKGQGDVYSTGCFARLQLFQRTL